MEPGMGASASEFREDEAGEGVGFRLDELGDGGVVLK